MTIVNIKTGGLPPLQARCADQGGYVWIRTASTDWHQIYRGGSKTRGVALTATPTTIRAVVRAWARQRARAAYLDYRSAR